MSLSRLIIAIVWFGFGALSLVARQRLGAPEVGPPGGAPRFRRFLLVLSIFFALVGLLWLDLAF